MATRRQVPGNTYGLAIAHAREQLMFGKSVSAVESQLARKYPSLAPIDVRSAVLAAVNARALGAALTSGNTSQAGVAGAVPINPGIPADYQYVVNVTYQVGGSSELRTRTVVINTPALLDVSDIVAEAEQAARLADSQGELNTDGSSVDWSVQPAYTVEAVYRRQ